MCDSLLILLLITLAIIAFIDGPGGEIDGDPGEDIDDKEV